MFSQTVDYALRATVYLAREAPSVLTSQQIADATLVPRSYLSKVLASLRRAGLIRAQRGVGGGVQLARAPHEVTMLDVVNAVDPIKRVECPIGRSADCEELCSLHEQLDRAVALVQETFRNATMADVVEGNLTRSHACPFPGSAEPQATLEISEFPSN